MAQTGLQDWIPRQHKSLMKKCLIEEWNNQCAYCGYTQKNKEMTLDHVIPLAKMGTDDWCNLLPACRSCNLSKGHSNVRQWYSNSDNFTTERWLKIKQHMNRTIEDVSVA